MHIPNATTGIKSKRDELTDALNDFWEKLRKGEITHKEYSEARQAIEQQIKIEEEKMIYEN